ncbi:MAG TPA: AraC family transcriptional regulator [Opitutaceae bacterium]
MATSEQHRAEYERRIHRVLSYIDRHIDEPIQVATLAKQASFSAFHFHRIFSAHLGETIGNYLTRRRVELAAARLASQPRLGVLNAALAVGFNSAEAFARAFKKHFGCSPTVWKMRSAKEYQKSKISQEVRSPSQAKRRGKQYRDRVKTNTTPITVKVIERPAVRIAYLRYQGEFGPAVGQFWQNQVYPWLAENNLLDAPKYGIARDDPTTTEKNKLRYDAGAEIGKKFVPPQNTQIDELPGGLYACARFRGTPANIQSGWDRLLREWLPSSGYQLDSRPCFEYYPSPIDGDEETGAFSCDLCIPVAKL